MLQWCVITGCVTRFNGVSYKLCYIPQCCVVTECATRCNGVSLQGVLHVAMM